jgi:hypothetical protein
VISEIPSELVELLVGVAGFEPAASSSRSQVPTRTARAATCLIWEAASMAVRWRPPPVMAIVTHLDTRSGRRPSAPWMS